ncbi:MAG: hypothetical protein AB7F86_20435 [Bdellovibrionales bacterium]
MTRAYWIAAISVVVLSFQACDPNKMGFRAAGNSPGSGGKSLMLNGGTTTDNPKPTIGLEVAPFAGDGAPLVFLCVAEIRLSEQTIRFDQNKGQPRWLALDPAGTWIESIDVPTGQYQGLEMRLKEECGGRSAIVINSHGEFHIAREMSLHFDGAISVSGSLSNLNLDMGPMIDALSSATTRSEVVSAMVEQVGSCKEGDDDDSHD